MGTFRVDVTVSNPRDPDRTVTLPLAVDTGATYTTLPREVADALGLQPIDTRRVRLADGREDRWPLAPILIRIEGPELPSLALIGPAGGPALLGAITLEAMALAVDPSAPDPDHVPALSARAAALPRFAFRARGKLNS